MVTPMLYWRDSYFQDLRDAAARASAQGWPHYAEYCAEQERGLRPRAFAALNQFLRDMKKAPLPERQRFVDWVLAFSDERRGHNQLVPHPLRTELVEPTLNEWLTAEPNNPAPHRWTGGRDHLERALQLDPSDQIARKKLIILLLSWISYATHELPRGYLGSVPQDLQILERVEALLPGLSNDDLRRSYAQTLSEEREAITIYTKRKPD